jgi:preprotein translocase subunit SecB
MFSLVTSKVKSLEMKQEDNEHDNLELNVNVGFSEEDDRTFIVDFKSTVLSSVGYTLYIEFASFFETEDSITEEFKSSYIPSVNAPAIAYPFFRTFVSNLTLNAGYDPIILPTINFQALAKEQQKSQETD